MMKRVFNTCQCQNCKTKFRESAVYRREAEAALRIVTKEEFDELDSGRKYDVRYDTNGREYRVVSDLNEGYYSNKFAIQITEG